MMGWKHTVTAMLMGAIAANVAIVQVVDAKSSKAKEIYDSANKFVVKIDEDDGGSGFIVRKSGNRYTVLTNDHVTKTSNEHTITTHDGKTYTSEGVRSFKSANGLDLAEIEFESNERYQVAQLASRPNYSVGTKVYTVGWNATNSNLTERRSNILEGTISGSQPRNESGYTLTMNLIAIPGMSGSPLLDENGKVIGIYGQANSQEQEGSRFATSTLGIQISNYREVTSSVTSVANDSPNDRTLARKPKTIEANNGSNRTYEKKFDYKGFKLLQTITIYIPGAGFETSAISHDGNTLVIGGNKGLEVRQVSDGTVTYSSDTDYGRIRSLAISIDGQTLVIGTDRGIEIRKTSNGRIVRQIDSKSGRVATNVDGTVVAIHSDVDKIKIYRVSDSQLIQTITARNPYLSSAEISDIAISPNGLYLAGVGRNDSIRIWQLSDGKLLKTFLRGSAQFSRVTFSMDSNILLVSGWSSPYDDHKDITQAWKISTGKSIATVEYPREFPNYNYHAISGNRRVMIGFDGNSLQIWRR